MRSTRRAVRAGTRSSEARSPGVPRDAADGPMDQMTPVTGERAEVSESVNRFQEEITGYVRSPERRAAHRRVHRRHPAAGRPGEVVARCGPVAGGRAHPALVVRPPGGRADPRRGVVPGGARGGHRRVGGPAADPPLPAVRLPARRRRPRVAAAARSGVVPRPGRSGLPDAGGCTADRCRQPADRLRPRPDRDLVRRACAVRVPSVAARRRRVAHCHHAAAAAGAHHAPGHRCRRARPRGGGGLGNAADVRPPQWPADTNRHRCRADQQRPPGGRTGAGRGRRPRLRSLLRHPGGRQPGVRQGPRHRSASRGPDVPRVPIHPAEERRRRAAVLLAASHGRARRAGGADGARRRRAHSPTAGRRHGGTRLHPADLRPHRGEVPGPGPRRGRRRTGTAGDLGTGGHPAPAPHRPPRPAPGQHPPRPRGLSLAHRLRVQRGRRQSGTPRRRCRPAPRRAGAPGRRRPRCRHRDRHARTGGSRRLAAPLAAQHVQRRHEGRPEEAEGPGRAGSRSRIHPVWGARARARGSGPDQPQDDLHHPHAGRRHLLPHTATRRRAGHGRPHPRGRLGLVAGHRGARPCSPTWAPR